MKYCCDDFKAFYECGVINEGHFIKYDTKEKWASDEKYFYFPTRRKVGRDIFIGEAVILYCPFCGRVLEVHG